MYLSEIRHLLPFIRKSEKKFLKDLQQTIYDYCETTESFSFHTLISVFGEPKDLVSNDIAEKDAATLYKELNFSKHIKTSVFLLLIIFISLALFRIHTIFLDYKNAQEAQIHHAVIVIEEKNK